MIGEPWGASFRFGFGASWVSRVRVEAGVEGAACVTGSGHMSLGFFPGGGAQPGSGPWARDLGVWPGEPPHPPWGGFTQGGW